HYAWRRLTLAPPPGLEDTIFSSSARLHACLWESQPTCRHISATRLEEDRGSRIEGRGSRIEDRRSRIVSLAASRSTTLDHQSSILDFGVEFFEGQVYQIHHARPRLVPGARRERFVHPIEPRVVVVIAPAVHQTLGCGDELIRRVGDLDQTPAPVEKLYVVYRSRDRRNSGRKIFRCLGRGDEPCRFVAGERRHRDVPSGEICR